jgi:tetratricopeptide (TPR) repeat protein
MIRLLLITMCLAFAATSASANGSADADAGVARLEAQDPRTAVELFTRAIQSKQLSPEGLALTYHRRGVAFYMQGESGRAILDYTIALWHEDLPREFRPRTLNNRGLAFEALNQYETALKDYGLSIRLNPNYADAYANRGNLRRRFNLNAEAVQDFDMALRGRHARPQFVFVWRGMALEALGKRREASESFRRALQIDNNLGEARAHLARLEKSQGLTASSASGRQALQNGRGGPLIPAGRLQAGSASPGIGIDDIPPGPWEPAAQDRQSRREASAIQQTGVGLRPALVEAGASARQVAAAQAASAPVPSAEAAAGQYYLQLGAYETAEQAGHGWNRISRAGQGLLEGIRHEVVRVEVAGRGTLYRLLAGSLAERKPAQQLCQALEDRGAACVVVRR